MPNITESSKTLELIMQARELLASQMVAAITAKHDIATAREDAKRVEDAIVLAIWSDERFKNDKVRNEQKHLARINNPDLIQANEYIKTCEINRAKIHASILDLQNNITLLTLQYEHFLLGSRTEAAAKMRMVAQLVTQEDTTDAIELKPELVSSVIGEEPVGCSMSEAGSSFADKLRASMSVEKIAELTSDEPVVTADPNAKVAGNTDTTVGEAAAERKEQDNALYSKPEKGDSEKIGGMRI
jgi:hypothetical protein